MTLLQANMDLPGLVVTLTKSFNIEKWLEQDISVWKAAFDLLDWFQKDGDLNLFLAFVMLFGFCICLTAASVAASLGLALRAGFLRDRDKLLPRMVRALRHLAMLDVCATGFIVLCMAATIYRENGIVFALDRGVYWLVASEVAHYAVHHSALTLAAAASCRAEGGFDR